MKDRYLIAISFLIVILQTTVFQLLRIGGVMPNIMLIWLVISIVMFGRFSGIKTAIYAGLFTDMLIGKGLGVYLLIYLAIASMIALLEEKIFKDNYITPIVLIIATTTIFHVFFFVIDYFATGDINLVRWLVGIVMPEIIYNLVIGVLAYTHSFRLYMGYHMR